MLGCQPIDGQLASPDSNQVTYNLHLPHPVEEVHIFLYYYKKLMDK